jgi:hypothetical protein
MSMNKDFEILRKYFVALFCKIKFNWFIVIKGLRIEFDSLKTFEHV